VKIVAQSTPDESGYEPTYFVVDDEEFDPTKPLASWCNAWKISRDSAPQLQMMHNGLWHIDHVTWYPFTGEQQLLGELLGVPLDQVESVERDWIPGPWARDVHRGPAPKIVIR
jgi:hypothetical protein